MPSAQIILFQLLAESQKVMGWLSS